MVSSYATQAFWFFDGLPTGRNPGAELLALPYPECQWAYQDTETGERRGGVSNLNEPALPDPSWGSFCNTRVAVIYFSPRPLCRFDLAVRPPITEESLAHLLRAGF
jgi:hypothetical protein